MQIISGSQIATEIKSSLKQQNTARGVNPCLAIVLVGNDPESAVYVKLKEKAVKAIDGRTEVINLPESTTKSELENKIQELNNNNDIDGILVQLPLPGLLQDYQTEILEVIDPKKDVDGFTPINCGRLLADKPGFISCAALGCLDVINRVENSLTGHKVLLIGDSFDLIKPLALLLLQKSWQVNIIPQYDPEIVGKADIVVIEKGAALLVKGKDIKSGALIIDAGFYWQDGHTCGNVDIESVNEVEGYLLPVPGGLGPLLIAKLMENLVKASYQGKGI